MSENIIEYRRKLHTIPEYDNNTEKTCEFIRSVLGGLGCKLSSPIKGSVCAFFDFGKEETFAFRSDIDALEIDEKTGAEYASKHPGYMHACGHDGHTAMLLGLAEYIDSIKEGFERNFLLIFQPSEETTGGAKLICESGILDEYNVRRVYGIHLWPDLPYGEIASVPGPMMARSSEVTVSVVGKSAHIAKASEGCDALLAANDFISRSYKSAQTEPKDPSSFLLRFGKMTSGSARNIISSETLLLGSMRSLDDDLFFNMQKRLNSIASEVGKSSGCKLTINFSEGYPPVNNSPELFKEASSQTVVPVTKLTDIPMIADDFSFYSQKVDSLYFFLGTGGINPLHSPLFDFDDRVLLHGLELYKTLISL